MVLFFGYLSVYDMEYELGCVINDFGDDEDNDEICECLGLDFDEWYKKIVMDYVNYLCIIISYYLGFDRS